MRKKDKKEFIGREAWFKNFRDITFMKSDIKSLKAQIDILSKALNKPSYMGGVEASRPRCDDLENKILTAMTNLHKVAASLSEEEFDKLDDIFWELNRIREEI